MLEITENKIKSMLPLFVDYILAHQDDTVNLNFHHPFSQLIYIFFVYLFQKKNTMQIDILHYIYKIVLGIILRNEE